MMALLFVGIWSPQSAWNLGETFALRVSSSVDVDVRPQQAQYAVNGKYVIGGSPTLTYHRGTSFGLELSVGAYFHIGLAALGGGPFNVGLKQTVFATDTTAVSLGATVVIVDFDIFNGGTSTIVQPELRASFALSEHWALDAALVGGVKAYWNVRLNDFQPRARLGATWQKTRHVIFMALEGGPDINFIGFAKPPPFPYILVPGGHAGLVAGYAWEHPK